MPYNGQRTVGGMQDAHLRGGVVLERGDERVRACVLLSQVSLVRCGELPDPVFMTNLQSYAETVERIP